MKSKKGLIKIFRKVILIIIISFVAMLIASPIVRYFIFQPFRVQVGSMIPTFQEDDTVIVNKLVYRFQKPNRGDVVVFHPPNNGEIYYIKRIIGLPGETIEVKDGNVFINGEQIKEDAYLNIETPGIYGQKILLENEFFVMGDNRNNSLDSREFGPIQLSSISGKVILIIWPLKNAKFI